MFSTFHISYSPAIVCIAQVTKGDEGVDLEKLAIVSTYALPVSELLGLNGFRVQDGELDANNTHSGFFSIFNTTQCQRNIRLYCRLAWKVIKLGLILGIYCQKLFSSSVARANYILHIC